MQSTYHRSADLLFRTASAMQSAAQALRRAAERLEQWLEDRRAARRARRELGMMSDYELKDIGLSRSDTWRVVHEDPYRPLDGMLAEVTPGERTPGKAATGERPFAVARRRALHAPIVPQRVLLKLPLPLAEEGWGEGVSASRQPATARSRARQQRRARS
jgi:uncharacterized protein YjiS (DUF1127 family)